MKKSIHIQEDTPGFAVRLKSNPTYVKVYSEKRKLLRHSKAVGTLYQFIGQPGRYIVETDGQIIKLEGKELEEQVTRLKDASSREKPSQITSLVARGSLLVNENVSESQDIEQLKAVTKTHLNQMLYRARRDIISDEELMNYLADFLEPSESKIIKQTLVQFQKEAQQIRKKIEKAKNHQDLMDIKPSFPKERLSS